MTTEKPSKELTDEEKADAKEVYNATMDKFHKKLGKPSKEMTDDLRLDEKLEKFGLKLTDLENEFLEELSKIDNEKTKNIIISFIEGVRELAWEEGKDWQLNSLMNSNNLHTDNEYENAKKQAKAEGIKQGIKQEKARQKKQEEEDSEKIIQGKGN